MVIVSKWLAGRRVRDECVVLGVVAREGGQSSLERVCAISGLSMARVAAAFERARTYGLVYQDMSESSDDVVYIRFPANKA